MSTGTLPPSLDVRKAAQRGTRIDVELAPADFPRLRQSLAGDAGSVNAQLVFARDEEQHYTISVQVSATLQVRCERCLQAFETQVESSSMLAAVWTDEQARALPSHLDPLLAEESVQLREVIEDELVLAMPMFSYHADPGCVANLGATLGVKEGAHGALAATERSDAKPNPFDVLSQLKGPAQDPSGE